MLTSRDVRGQGGCETGLDSGGGGAGRSGCSSVPAGVRVKTIRLRGAPGIFRRSRRFRRLWRRTGALVAGADSQRAGFFRRAYLYGSAAPSISEGIGSEAGRGLPRRERRDCAQRDPFLTSAEFHPKCDWNCYASHEERSITIARSSMTLHFPANFVLGCGDEIPALGGFHGDPTRSAALHRRHQQTIYGKVSGLVDRIDLHMKYPRSPTKKRGKEGACRPLRCVTASRGRAPSR